MKTDIIFSHFLLCVRNAQQLSQWNTVMNINMTRLNYSNTVKLKPISDWITPIASIVSEPR